MSPSNVLKFPGGKSSDLSLKVFVIIFLCFLAYLMTLGTHFSGNGFMILIVLGVLYQFFVRQGLRYQSYFKQNRLLLIILLIIFILVFQWQMIWILLLSAIYWLMIGRSGREAPYFVRFHILTGLIVNFFILLAYFLLVSALNLLGPVFSLVGFSVGAAFVENVLTFVPLAFVPLAVVPLAFLVVFGLGALWLSWNVLMGRTPYIGWVTVNVRHWV